MTNNNAKLANESTLPCNRNNINSKLSRRKVIELRSKLNL